MTQLVWSFASIDGEIHPVTLPDGRRGIRWVLGEEDKKHGVVRLLEGLELLPGDNPGESLIVPAHGSGLSVEMA